MDARHVRAKILLFAFHDLSSPYFSFPVLSFNRRVVFRSLAHQFPDFLRPNNIWQLFDPISFGPETVEPARRCSVWKHEAGKIFTLGSSNKLELDVADIELLNWKSCTIRSKRYNLNSLFLLFVYYSFFFFFNLSNIYQFLGQAIGISCGF